MSIYTVENFTSDITVEGYIAEFRDEPHFLELCKQCTNYGKSWINILMIINQEKTYPAWIYLAKVNMFPTKTLS